MTIDAKIINCPTCGHDLTKRFAKHVNKDMVCPECYEYFSWDYLTDGENANPLKKTHIWLRVYLVIAMVATLLSLLTKLLFPEFLYQQFSTTLNDFNIYILTGLDFAELLLLGLIYFGKKFAAYAYFVVVLFNFIVVYNLGSTTAGFLVTAGGGLIVYLLLNLRVNGKNAFCYMD